MARDANITQPHNAHVNQSSEVNTRLNRRRDCIYLILAHLHLSHPILVAHLDQKSICHLHAHFLILKHHESVFIRMLLLLTVHQRTIPQRNPELNPQSRHLNVNTTHVHINQSSKVRPQRLSRRRALVHSHPILAHLHLRSLSDFHQSIIHNHTQLLHQLLIFNSEHRESVIRMLLTSQSAESKVVKVVRQAVMMHMNLDTLLHKYSTQLIYLMRELSLLHHPCHRLLNWTKIKPTFLQ